MVFLSHSSKDDPVVYEISQALDKQGIEVWADSERLRAGDELEPEVLKAIDGSTHLLAVLSMNAVNSGWVLKEVRYALERGKKVIPLMLPDIKPAALQLWFPKELVGIPIDPANFAACLPELLRGLEGAKRRLDAAPLAELILELIFPKMEGERAAASAKLVYRPPGGAAALDGPRFQFTAPLGPIEAGDLAWYLERYCHWPSGVFAERAREIEAKLPAWGKLLFDAVHLAAGGVAVKEWNTSPADTQRCFTVKVEAEPEDAAAKRRGHAAVGVAVGVVARRKPVSFPG